MEFKIYLTNLGMYNNGELVGKWVNLPCDNLLEELESIGVKAGTEYEEFFITDYENDWGVQVGEYDDLDTLNDLAQKLADVEDKGDGNWLRAFLEAYSDDVEYALDNYEDSAFYPEMSLEEVAEELINECYEVPEGLENYIDYASYARDLGYDGYTETEYGTIYIY